MSRNEICGLWLTTLRRRSLGNGTEYEAVPSCIDRPELDAVVLLHRGRRYLSSKICPDHALLIRVDRDRA